MRLEIPAVGGVERSTRKGPRMPPETFEAIDLTELAELLEDEDCESDDSEHASPSTTSAGEIAVA